MSNSSAQVAPQSTQKVTQQINQQSGKPNVKFSSIESHPNPVRARAISHGIATGKFSHEIFAKTPFERQKLKELKKTVDNLKFMELMKSGVIQSEVFTPESKKRVKRVNG